MTGTTPSGDDPASGIDTESAGHEDTDASSPGIDAYRSRVADGDDDVS